MKKVLLGSTAFVGAAMMFAAPAAADWEYKITGFLKAQGWVTSQDDDSVASGMPRGYSFGLNDWEVQVKAKNTSDNGLTYGINFEFENKSTGNGFGADEAYLYIGGDWGQIQLGGNDGATDTMPYSGDFSLTATGGYDGDLQNVYNVAGEMIANPDLAADTGDSAKIIYVSPRFSGVQFAVNYAPDGGQGLATDAEDSFGGSAEDVFQIGVNFVDTINGVDIGIGGAYSTSSPEDGAAAGLEDTEGLHVGLNIGFSGFTVGGSYGDNFDSGCTTTAGCDGGQFYEFAGGYSTGPFSIGVGYFHAEKDVSSSVSDEIDIISITGQYTLAPGLVLYSEYNHVDEDAESEPDNEADIFMLGVAASF